MVVLTDIVSRLAKTAFEDRVNPPSYLVFNALAPTDAYFQQTVITIEIRLVR